MLKQLYAKTLKMYRPTLLALDSQCRAVCFEHGLLHDDHPEADITCYLPTMSIHVETRPSQAVAKTC